MEIEKIIGLLREAQATLWPELVKAAQITGTFQLVFGLILMAAGVVFLIVYMKTDYDQGVWMVLTMAFFIVGIFLCLLSYYWLSTLEYQAYKLLIGQ